MTTQIERINKVAKMVGVRTAQEDKLEPDWGSENSINRVKDEFEKIAKEPMEIEITSGPDYAYVGYGSELAVLRLFYEYNQWERIERTRIGQRNDDWSSNTGWYFILEIS